MTTSRRAFLRTTSLAAFATGIDRLVPPFVTRHLDLVTGTPDPALTELAAKALDAARAAGASYADVRFSFVVMPYVSVEDVRKVAAFMDTTVAVGVRALVDGYWGFFAGTAWSVDAVTQLARAAVANAKVVAWGSESGARLVELAPTPAVAGRWTTPIERDPLDVPPAEIITHVQDAQRAAGAIAGPALAQVATKLLARRADLTFASTDGSVLHQRQYTMFVPEISTCQLTIRSTDGSSSANASAFYVWPQAGGYELLTRAKLKEQMPEIIERAKRALNPVPGDLGRYDLVLDARSVAWLLASTLGRATQLDRALGAEANATGTSFLAPPESVLGQGRVAAPDFTVSADRTVAGGAAGVGWDDEGVAPDRFPLVDKGILVDYQTDRERAVRLTAWYGTRRQPVRSHGCASAQSALTVPIPTTPNLTLAPGTGASAGTLDELVHGVRDGYVFMNARSDIDQMALNGQSVGAEAVFRIRKGKVAEPVSGMNFVYRTPEVWRAVTGLGAIATALTVGVYDSKGEPAEQSACGVTAVPVRLTNMRVGSFARNL